MLAPYWKKIGLVLTIISFVSYVALQVIYDLYRNYPIAQVAFEAFAILSLLFIAFAKEKKEDELLKRIRAISIARAFFFTIFFCVFMSFMFTLIELPIWSANLFVIYQLGMYLIFFHTQKKRDFEKDEQPKFL